MLTVFIDALPADFHDRMPQMQEVGSFARLVPSLGYSVNLHHEIFCGLRPDDVEFFGEFRVRPAQLEIPPPIPLRMAGGLESLSTRSARIVRLAGNRFARLFRVKGDYIPFQMRHRFERVGKYPLLTRPTGSFLRQLPWSFHVGDAVQAPLGRRDSLVLGGAQDAVRRGLRDIFLSLCDLDGLFHAHGTEGRLVEERVAWIDREIPMLVHEYSTRHPGECVVVLSDHGIRDCEEHIDLRLPHFCRKYPRTTFFADSLYLAVWDNDRSRLSEVENDLLMTEGLRLISEGEREFHGVGNRLFGDLLFVAKSGVAISPNFFGFRRLRAYHGYYPEEDNTHGLVFANMPLEKTVSTLDMFRYLSSWGRR